MLRLENLSVRQKLYGVVLISTLGLVGVAAVAAWLLAEFRIGGPVYQQIARAKDIEGATAPSTLGIVEGYLLLFQLDEATDPTRIAALRGRFNAVEALFREQHDYWQKALPEGEVRSALATKLRPPAQEFYQIAQSDFLPAKLRGDAKATREFLQGPLRSSFDRQRQALEEVVRLTREYTKAEEASAGKEMSGWFRVMFLVGLATVAAVVLSGTALAGNVVGSTQLLTGRVRELASGAGDLTARLQVVGKDEFSALANSINGMIAKIQSIVERVREASVQLLSTASQIAAAASQQESSMQGLGGSTTEIAAAVQEITATSKQLADTMSGVNSQANQASALAAEGRSRLTDMQKAMQQLVDSTASISGKLALIREKAENINVVVTTITKVADQTNLLSINAAIEAEKAGEFGRGFLVVAREIRRLADQTAVATLDIENMVRLMHDAVSSGVMQMDKFSDDVRTGMSRVGEMGRDAGRIIEEVQGLSERFEHVNESMSQQSVGAQQINEAMLSVSSTTRQQATALDEFKKATSYLRQSVESLNREVGQFKV